MIIRVTIVLLAAFALSCSSLDRVTTLAEFRDLNRAQALKIVPRLPKDAKHIYIKRVLIYDSAVLYLRYTVPSKESLLEFKNFISKKVDIKPSATKPARWPRFNALPFAEKPLWWSDCTGTQYYYELKGGYPAPGDTRGQGALCCIDEAKNEVSIWYWNLKDWNAPGKR